MKDIYHTNLKPNSDELVLIGGSGGSDISQVCDEYAFKNYITVEELAAVRPELVPLSYKAGFSLNKDEIK